MKTYKKKDIENMVVKESRLYKIFEKKDLRLVEDEKNAYVEPSSDSMSSLANDLSKTKTQNPTDNTFVVDMNSYDGNSGNNPVVLDVKGKNPADASKNINKLTQQPSVRQLMKNNNVTAKVHLNTEAIQRLRETSVPFSKKELNKLLLK